VPPSSGQAASGQSNGLANGQSNGSAGQSQSDGSLNGQRRGSRGALAWTGDHILLLVVIAVLCVAAGAIVTRLSRRRQASPAGFGRGVVGGQSGDAESRAR
jgi:hypothetical protein